MKGVRPRCEKNRKNPLDKEDFTDYNHHKPLNKTSTQK